MPQAYATPIPSMYHVQPLGSLDGAEWLFMDYDGTHDAYKATPVVLSFRGKSYIRTGCNSDTLRVYYSTRGIAAEGKP